MNPNHRVLKAIRAEYQGRLPHGLLWFVAREFGLSKRRALEIMEWEDW